ncbi:uncharacterized protein LOC135218449 [Macrobrachium nipponense]|uniref:uncharacterized protein LOC135218449 n=1 Tax=Macrobrachium nipponense TaxID=159736 RepID=UPI0030C876D6
MKFFAITLFAMATVALTQADPIPVEQGVHAPGITHPAGQLGHAGDFASQGSGQGYGKAESSNTFSFGAPLAEFQGFHPGAQAGHTAAAHAAEQGQTQAHPVYTN